MTKKKKIWLTVSILGVFLIGWIIWGNTHIEVTKINIRNEKIPNGFNGYKIAEIADLHNYDWGYSLIKLLKVEKPDIIAITGDLIDSKHTDLYVAMEFVKNAQKIAPVYFVTGNHEAWSKDYPKLKEMLISLDVIILDNSTSFVEKNGENILLMGIQDPDFKEINNLLGEQDTLFKEKINELKNNDKYYTILLSHRPEKFETYVETGVDLVLTGHAHGGQVRLPFIGGLVAPNQGFFPKYTEGVFKKNKTEMVVSRGLGNSIIPVRINNTPELVIIELNK